MSKFIILRDRNDVFRTGPMASVTTRGLSPLSLDAPRSDVPPAPQLDTEELAPRDLRDAARDPSIRVIARSMPTKLVEPEAGAADATPTWGITAVGAEATNATGSGVRVAVLDTGIDEAHPAFAGVTLNTNDFSGDGIHDGHGHGTHCAGTIFGRDVDGTRIGVARGVTDALIGKVLGNDGSGSSEMLFQALRWCADENAKVISMSLGFDFPGLGERLQQDGFPPLLATSIALEAYRMNLRMFDALMDMFRAQAAFDGGTVVCAASGNESRRQIDPNFEVSASIPAAAFDVFSVGALGEGAGGLTVANFSNTNPVLAAPGVNIVSARSGGGLRALNGTSMACPHVAGVTALWWEALNAAPLPATSDGVKARLRASAVTAPLNPGTDPLDRGHGLVQAPSASMF
ncbi:S8 family peptidase [Antarctobacter sp.]|uniref:S8 family peptidase n=1 Tax=Antarctobacter sp. TaxID=1872577 RepID=UPI002B26FE9D|nr:S8 family serine peptidase [Antarctobacter sp.]